MLFKYKTLLLTLAMALLVLAACNLPNESPNPSGVNAEYTAAAQTVIAQLTQGASQPTPVSIEGMQTAAAQTVIAQITQQATPVIPTQIPTQLPTNTPVPPTNTPLPPTNTLVPTAIPIPCDRGSFVKDVTFDDTDGIDEVNVGTQFVKTWRLKNNGSCTWNSGYALVFDHGDAMLPSGSSAFQLTTGTVAPGETIDVSVTLKAPDAPGTYQGYWKLRNSAGVVFGIGADTKSSFWVKVKVINPATATPAANVTFDFFSKGPDAEWHNGSSTIPWGDPPSDSAGVAVSIDSAKLNDNKTYNRLLALYPQQITDGMVYGIFPNYTVQEGDRFRTRLGFKNDCGSGNVKFQLRYREGATETIMGEWLKTCDNGLITIDIDLAALKGKTVQFVLVVYANGSYNDDRSIWVNPRIEH